nr:FtsX-like permease family protein [Ktedonobacterales bacterium]
GLGVGAAYLVRSLVEGAFFLHLQIPLDWPTLASGIGIGVLTALIFGLVPIAQASRVRPIAVLREDAGGARLSWLVTGALFAVLSLLFVGLSTLILQDVLTAALVVYGGIALVVVMAGGFGALVSLIARLPVYERPRATIILWLLPALLALGATATGLYFVTQRISQINLLTLTGGLPTDVKLTLAAGGLALLLTGGAAVYALATLADVLVMFAPRGAKTAIMLAYRNMGRQRTRTTATLTALFVGVFAIGMILILGQGIKDTINNTLGTLFAHNVFVVTATGKQAETLPLLNAAPGVSAADTVAATVTRVRPTQLAGRDIADVLAELGTGTQGIAKRNTLLLTLSIAQGYNVGSCNPHDLPDIAIDYGRNLTASDAGTGAVVVNDLLRADPIHLREGDTLTVTDPNGVVTRTLTVVGFFSRSGTTDFVPGEVIGDAGEIAPLGGSFARDIYLLKANTQQIPALRTYLDQTLPTAQVVSITDLNQIIDRILNNLIVMLTAIASLALVAGLIIIANAVALAMLERRREIGILKSVGHTSRSILAMVLIENGVVGLLGALVALLLVVGAVLALSTFLFRVTLTINAPLVGGILALTVGVTLLIAALVAWGATRLRPLEVLRYE